MPKQPAFPGLRNGMKKKVTRREQFLAEMDALAPWGRLLALIALHHPKIGPKGGRPPTLLDTMLRVYFLQNWYQLAKNRTQLSTLGNRLLVRRRLMA